MRTVQLYIEDQRIDLFNDEEIKVTSSVQNIDDISKNFTDFSQTFTVPASPNNNQVFEHYYNNDLDGQVNANLRRSARIEINYLPFRKGKVQLEGSEIKNGQASSYRLTFYGDVVTLKDHFGKDKLRDLDYSSTTFSYTGANVQTALTNNTVLDVRFPLISSNRVWTYGDAAATDISTSGGAIAYTELFPALRDQVILDAIEAKYGVTFEGTFLGDNRFKRSFTWWKNRQFTNFILQPQNVIFNNANTPLANSQVSFEYIDPVSVGEAAGTSLQLKVTMWVLTNFTGTVYLDIYNASGVLLGTYSQDYVSGAGAFFSTTNGSTSWLQGAYNSQYGVQSKFSYKFRADATGTIDAFVNFEVRKNAYATLVTAYQAQITQITVTNYIDWNSSAPDIEVQSWFSGLLKEFNMVCVPKDLTGTTYILEPLEIWYASGDVINITPYTDMENVKVDRIAPYKEINFTWEKSKSLLNVAFQGFYQREYGDLQYIFPFDGGKYDVKLPFENLLFQKFTGENLQVSYSLESAPDYKHYVPKPVKLFLYASTTSCDFYLDTGSPTQITSYIPMGQDQNAYLENYSQNFGAEQSSFLDAPINNSLYETYYKTYLVNMFSPKSRKVSVKCVLPLKMLLDLDLQDKVILRDKAYRINNMTTNLTTGLVDLVLVSDWAKERRRVPIKPVVVHTGGTIVIPVQPIKPTKGGYIIITDPGTPFTTSSLTSGQKYYDPTNWEITIPTNSTGNQRTEDYTISWYRYDGTLVETQTYSIYQDPEKSFLLAEDNAYILTEDLKYILLE